MARFFKRTCQAAAPNPKQAAIDEAVVLGSSLFTVFLCLFIVLFS